MGWNLGDRVTHVVWDKSGPSDLGQVRESRWLVIASAVMDSSGGSGSPGATSTVSLLKVLELVIQEAGYESFWSNHLSRSSLRCSLFLVACYSYLAALKSITNHEYNQCHFPALQTHTGLKRTPCCPSIQLHDSRFLFVLVARLRCKDPRVCDILMLPLFLKHRPSSTSYGLRLPLTYAFFKSPHADLARHFLNETDLSTKAQFCMTSTVLIDLLSSSSKDLPFQYL